jgi:F-type H+-transporting ATPase subunit gamma
MSGKLKEVRERIKSVNSTQQITKAMKMVSAAKLRRAQQAIQQMRPYANRLNKILKNVIANVGSDIESPFAVPRDLESVVIVVITSNRGLCGAFNTNIIKQATSKIDNEYASYLNEGKLKIVCIGKKGYEALRRKYGIHHINNNYVDLFSDLSFENISKVSSYLMEIYANGEADRIDICYSQFRNAAVHIPQAIQYLPVKIDDEKAGQSATADYIFEPDKVSLLEELIPNILHISFMKSILDTHAGEHGARMTAMDNATTNAEELMKDLKINYNKARQEAITKELSEIVGGAAALGG